jgi:uncharacterized protein (DUF697 family)
VVLCVTTLHEAIPRQPLPVPYPFGNHASPGIDGPYQSHEAHGSYSSPPPDDLRRSIDHHTQEFSGLFDELVPIDFTRPEDKFPDPNYGGEHLKETLLRVLPEAYRQTLLQLKEATETLKDVHLRHAVPVIMGYSTMAATAGAVPVPFVDMVIIPGIQARMAHHIAGLYGQPMTTERIKEIAAAVGVGMISRQLARQATKFIPVVGSAVGAAVGGASTYAFGRALCYYFQAVHEGHVPNASALKAYYKEQYADAEKKWKRTNEARNPA